jgi:hypothetical protein
MTGGPHLSAAAAKGDAAGLALGRKLGCHLGCCAGLEGDVRPKERKEKGEGKQKCPAFSK